MEISLLRSSSEQQLCISHGFGIENSLWKPVLVDYNSANKNFSLFYCLQVTIFTCDVLWVQGLPCPIGSLTVLSSSFKKGYKCINCSEYGPCPEGHGWSVVCDTTVTNETSIECLECVEGKSFSPTYDHSQCQDCQSISCLMHEKVAGKCTTEKDSTVCMGVCKKGFFMNSNKTRCLPCSTCQSGNTVIKKCLLDGMPRDMQCRPQGSLAKENCTVDEFGVIGHPASFGVLVAVVAVSLLVIVICTCIYCRRSQQQSGTVVLYCFLEYHILYNYNNGQLKSSLWLWERHHWAVFLLDLA